MKIIIFYISLISLFGFAISARKAAKYVFGTVAQRPSTIQYKKIVGSSYFALFGETSKAKCSIVCLDEDSCDSFYIDGGECVFGITGDVRAFEDGEEATVDGGQRIHVKGLDWILTHTLLVS